MDGNGNTCSATAETRLVGDLDGETRVSTKVEKEKCGETYDGDELRISGESEWERHSRTVVREGLVDDRPDLYIVWGCRWANWDDEDLVGRRTLALDGEGEFFTLGGYGGKFEGICGYEGRKEEKRKDHGDIDLPLRPGHNPARDQDLAQSTIRRAEAVTGNS